MKVEVIRTTGEREQHDLPRATWLEDMKKLIGAEMCDTVLLKDRVHVMFVDDAGWEYEEIHSLGPHPHRPGELIKTVEHKVGRARKPINSEATKLYWEKCGGVVDHQIVGDVAIVNDRDCI